MSDLSVDVSELKRLSSDLRRVDPALQKEFLKGLGLVGEAVATLAREKASFSTRIPGSVKVRRRGVNVRVEAGGTSAPDAAPLDNRGRGGTFRHPVFGDREVWVSQPAHPFLEPAAEESAGVVDVILLGVVEDAFIVGGFRG